MRTPVTKTTKPPVIVSDNDSGNDQNSGDENPHFIGQSSDEDELSTTSTKTNKSGGTKESPDVLAKRMSKTQAKVQAMKKQKREDTNPSPACKCVSMSEHICV
jgi:hypothetical protein